MHPAQELTVIAVVLLALVAFAAGALVYAVRTYRAELDEEPTR